jgi:hypothetical protein
MRNLINNLFGGNNVIDEKSAALGPETKETDVSINSYNL